MATKTKHQDTPHPGGVSFYAWQSVGNCPLAPHLRDDIPEAMAASGAAHVDRGTGTATYSTATGTVRQAVLPVSASSTITSGTVLRDILIGVASSLNPPSNGFGSNILFFRRGSAAF